MGFLSLPLQSNVMTVQTIAFEMTSMNAHISLLLSHQSAIKKLNERKN
jgi:hypothetical protein